MNRNCDHYVVMRFNRGRPDREFFDYRLALFQTITYPSLATQTCGEFFTIALMDPQTSTAGMAKLRRLLEDLPGGGATSVTGPETFGRRDKGRFMMTRMDNDDAISPVFIERLHASCDEPGYYCFRRGIFWDAIKRQARVVSSRAPNQFLTRVAVSNSGAGRYGPGPGWTVGRAGNVYEVKHRDADPCFWIDEPEPMWLWTIHSEEAEFQMSNASGKGVAAFRGADGWRPEAEILDGTRFVVPGVMP